MLNPTVKPTGSAPSAHPESASKALVRKHRDRVALILAARKVPR